MSLTISDLLINPSGKGSANFFSRAMIKDMMTDIMRKKVTFYPQGTSGMLDGFLHLHIKVSSTKFKELLYDVVIAIDATSTESIELRNIKVFSNSPNFQFTYAYVINEMGAIIPQLTGKCLPKALTDAPTVRNPSESLGFEKSILFALLWLKDRGILNFKTLMDSIGKNQLVINKLISNVKTSGQIKKEYDRLKIIDADRRQAEKEKLKKEKTKETEAALGGFSMTKKKSSTAKLAKTTSLVKNTRLVRTNGKKR